MNGDNNSAPHATVFDIPGWPCPPRVRDIPNHENSWGHIALIGNGPRDHLATDELGHLWVNGDVAPKFMLPSEEISNPGAIIFAAQSGIGLYLHPKSYRFLRSVSRLDLQKQPGQWLPVNEVATDLPDFVKEAL
ncbi:hypothetical protein [Nocardia sp. NPDC050710]|uniref:hypothetical protein n=1 Tax=Nocardia sp. NPDC050710 TaxID=3157220 RepID=UPI0034079E82